MSGKPSPCRYRCVKVGLRFSRTRGGHGLNPRLSKVPSRPFPSSLCGSRLSRETFAMVTGVETTGIILAILPLVVNQLDSYVQGLETIKTFRTKRYRRELESYLTRLGTAQAIFWNTLEHLLEDVVDSDEEVRNLISNPRGPSWQDVPFQMRLQRRLGRDHDIYFKTMTILSGLLQNLSDKLGLESNLNGDGKVRTAIVVITI
jgi:hypothetical protein